MILQLSQFDHSKGSHERLSVTSESERKQDKGNASQHLSLPKTLFWRCALITAMYSPEYGCRNDVAYAFGRP